MVQMGITGISPSEHDRIMRMKKMLALAMKRVEEQL